MSEVFYIKQNDTSPAIGGTCKDADGNAVTVTSATVAFHMRDAVTGAVVVDAAGSVVSGPAGTIQYEWDAADTATAGRYKAEFEVTYSDGKIETFPNSGYVTVIIGDDIA